MIQERRSTPQWNQDKRSVVKQILENWGLHKQFTEDDVFRVEGILDVNTIEFYPHCKDDENEKGNNHNLSRQY